MGEQLINEHKWGVFVRDLELNFHRPFRDAKVSYTAFADSVDIKGITSINVCELAKWCAHHHNLNYEIDTRNHTLIIRLMYEESFDVDTILVKEFTYAALNKPEMAQKLKQAYPRDWNRIEQLLMPFVYKDDFKCNADTNHIITSFGRDIQIRLKECVLNGTTVYCWLRKSRDDAYPVRIEAKIGLCYITTKQFEPRVTHKNEVKKFKPY